MGGALTALSIDVRDDGSSLDPARRACGLNATVTDVFQISGFSKMFQTFATTAEARAGF